MSLSKGIFIVAAKRTAFGSYGGKLAQSGKSIIDLQEIACKAALQETAIDPKIIDSVVIGNVWNTTSDDAIYLPRHVLLRCGIPIEKNAFAINRLCGSGFQSIVNGIHDILISGAKVVMTGGVECMSSAPYLIRNSRFGIKLGTETKIVDALGIPRMDWHIKKSLGMTAETLAQMYKMTREETDRFSYNSQMKWKNANEKGYFNEELAPVSIKIKGKESIFSTDEFPKPNTTMEGLAKLSPAFKKDGLLTAGSSSGISDGSGCVIIASEEALKEYNLKPLVRILGYDVAGVDPNIMGIGPVPAIQKVLKKTELTLDQIDIIEINEAFSAQTLACAKELKLDMSKLNVNGGAISIGHPLGASGSRIMSHLTHELKRRSAKYGIGSACIGGGMGISILIQNV